jgi:acyl transferase domain-containing protein
MQSTAHGAMLAVSAPLARVAAWIEGTGVDVAAINGPEAIVVAGARGAIDALAARLNAEGVKARPLIVSHASHSRMMDPILRALGDTASQLTFRAPRLPVIANLTGRRAAADEYDAAYWCRHLREPVRFHDGAQALGALDIDVCLEIGPDRTLVNLVTAAGLLPAAGGVASLRRGASDRASIRGAVEALHEHGQDFAWSKMPAASSQPRGLAPHAVASALWAPREPSEPRAAHQPGAWLRHELLGADADPGKDRLRAAIRTLVADALGDATPANDTLGFSDMEAMRAC